MLKVDYWYPNSIGITVYKCLIIELFTKSVKQLLCHFTNEEMKATLQETKCPKLHIELRRRVSLLPRFFFLFVSNSFCHNLALSRYFWLLSNTSLNQRPIVSWSSTTKSWWECWKAVEEKIHLGKHNRCEFHQSKCFSAEALFCWAFVLTTGVKMKLTKKKSLIIKDRKKKMQKRHWTVI